jgi:hypothetical protein
MKIYGYCFIFFCLTALFGNVWVETTQQDFRDCEYECNLYASHRDGGSVEFTTRWDLNGDGYLDVVVANERADVSYIYWGSETGFDPQNHTVYTVTNAGNCESEDLNGDGYSDLVFTSCTGNCVRIFWGTPSGPSPAGYTSLPIYSWNETCYVADFNKDGYLDIAVGHYDSVNGAIFWGSAAGFAAGSVTLLPGGGRHNFEVADFDKNGWLDILFAQQLHSLSVIYWGQATGYNPSNTTVLPNPGSHTHGCSVADLDKNGFLDVVLTCFGGDALYIYAGSPGGFFLWKVLNPGPCYGGTTIADMNTDGYLDITCARGYGVQAKPVVYWGNAAGYSEQDKTEIGIPVDASGILAADYNNDGHLDVMVHNYAYPPEPSYILMGPGYMPQYQLPTFRDHHGRFREIGNVYNREYYEDYISSVFDAGSMTDWGMIEWDASLPGGSSILFWIRTGDTPVLDDSWLDWIPVANGATIPDAYNARYIQYKARLAFVHPCYLPCLEEVRVIYNTCERDAAVAEVRCIPNPVRGNAWIHFPCIGDEVKVSVYGADGALIRDLNDMYLHNSQGSAFWDRKDQAGRTVSRGVYFIRIQDGNVSASQKVVVLE